VFDAWAAEAAVETVARMHRGIAPYVPGEFLRRELPCILPLVRWALEQHEVRVVIVDGFVDLEAGRPGLGRHLAAELPAGVTVVGVSKTPFKGEPGTPILRGGSTRPLWVTSTDDESEAAANILSMAGDHRIPALLKLADAVARGHTSPTFQMPERRILPPLLEAYVRRVLPEHIPGPARVLLHQTGEMRLTPARDWMPFTAEQTIAADKTEFVWHARFKMAPLVTAVVEDAFEGGHGRLDAKIWGVIPVAHARGIDVDRGERQRYLAELPWCPMALLYNEELQFDSVGEREIRVWVGDPQTYVDLRFDEAGDIVGTYTETRKRDDITHPWEGRFSDYRDFAGVRAPARGEVMWHLPEGEFTYWRGEVTHLAVVGNLDGG
jgi:deoxyribonuclease V